jgi:hypothetical protein
MSDNSEDFPVEKGAGPRRRFAMVRALWPRLIELWLSAVLVTFILIRVFGSQTAQRLLSRFTHSHLP